MKKLRIFGYISAIIFGFNSVPLFAGEWGCKVLLCASSPSGWQRESACHPPMYKLIACRAKTFGACSWPTCPEAGVGAPKFKRYEDCPAGWKISSGPQGKISSNDNNMGYCERLKPNSCKKRYSNYDMKCTPEKEYKGRPQKIKPYYFELKNTNTGQHDKSWFNLNK